MGLDKKKILVVDDDSIELELLDAALGETYEVHLVENELEALTKMEQEMPDLVIMDIMMPQIDGVSIYIAQKQNEKLADIPVIFITAIGDEEYKEQMLSWGAQEYITKPFDMGYVRETIARIIK